MEHKVVSHDEWVAARKKHLLDEKEFTKARDRLSQARRDLPWEVVDKEYEFEGDKGRTTLAGMFDGRSQLVIYHAMFNPGTAGPNTSWTKDAACFVCTWWLDNIDRQVVHLNHKDVTIASASMAPFKTFEAYRKRMGWSIPVYSAAGSDFNFDYQVSVAPDRLSDGKAEYNYREGDASNWPSESPGVSVFKSEGGKVYHTYSTYARGLDMLNVGYHYLDIVPKGRDEAVGGPTWIHRRDEYNG